jgi:hypothetical protein
MAGGRADSSCPLRLRRSLSPALLILDDFALREYSVTQSEDRYEPISRRYRRGSLILTFIWNLKCRLCTPIRVGDRRCPCGLPFGLRRSMCRRL